MEPRPQYRLLGFFQLSSDSLKNNILKINTPATL